MSRRPFLPLVFLAGALAARGQPAPPPLLSLAEAKTEALRNHPQVAIGQLRALVAQEDLKQHQAAYLPQITAYADAVAAGNRDTRILAGGLSNSVIYDRVAEGVGASQLITDFGQTRNLVASARLSARAEKENAAAIDQQILLSVAANYFNALQAQAVLAVAQATVASRQLVVDQITALAKNQLKSELDVSFAEVALEQAKLLLQQASGDQTSAEGNLAAALGERMAHAFTLADEPAPPPVPAAAEPLIDLAWSNRPDLLRLRYAREAAARYARAEADRNYPTLAAVGEIGTATSHDYRLPDKYAVGGITLDLPLFAGGADLAQARAARAQAQIAAETVRDEEDTVSRDVRQAWVNVTTADQRLRTTQELLRHANQALALAQARYRFGGSSIVELNDAQVNATSAQIAAANARYSELIQRAVLDFQTGTLH